MQDFTAIILAGGKSSRMGQNKAFLPLGEDVEIVHLIKVAKQMTDKVIVVTNDFEPFQQLALDITLVRDLRKGMGPLAGIEAGLTATATEHNLCIACDMPFITAGAGLSIMMHAQTSDVDATVPMIDGRRHPLFASYRTTCLPALTSLLDHDQRKIIDLLEQVHTKWLTEKDIPHMEKDIFFNMNTMEDYLWAKENRKTK